MYSFKLLKKSALLAVVSIIVITMACQNKSGYKDLFDGKTLNGWKVINQDWTIPEPKPDFRVEDNMIVCHTNINNRGGAYLVTEKLYDNFILELDVRDSSVNSGVQCRGRVWERDTTSESFSGVARQSKWRAGYVWGYQIEVDPSSRAWSGGLYEPGNRGWLVSLTHSRYETARKAYKRLDWNHFKIVMNGNRIQTWVNDVPIVDTTDNMSASGFIGLQYHGAGGKSEKDETTMWKNIKIKEL